MNYPLVSDEEILDAAQTTVGPAYYNKDKGHLYSEADLLEIENNIPKVELFVEGANWMRRKLLIIED